MPRLIPIANSETPALLALRRTLWQFAILGVMAAVTLARIVPEFDLVALWCVLIPLSALVVHFRQVLMQRMLSSPLSAYRDACCSTTPQRCQRPQARRACIGEQAPSIACAAAGAGPPAARSGASPPTSPLTSRRIRQPSRCGARPCRRIERAGVPLEYTARMKTTLRVLLIAALLALAACGNKGNLVLPDKPASPAVPASPDTPTPPSASPAASPASPAG